MDKLISVFVTFIGGSEGTCGPDGARHSLVVHGSRKGGSASGYFSNEPLNENQRIKLKLSITRVLVGLFLLVVCLFYTVVQLVLTLHDDAPPIGCANNACLLDPPEGRISAEPLSLIGSVPLIQSCPPLQHGGEVAQRTGERWSPPHTPERSRSQGSAGILGGRVGAVFVRVSLAHVHNFH
jgi:hypothetical protein